MYYDADVLIIGAGPAGTVAAAGLLRQNKSIIILEKDIFPRFVIGESLLPRCNDILEKCGLLAPVERANFMKKEGAVFFRGARREQFDFDETFHEGWKYTYQVPRADFDKILADSVTEMGADIRYRCEVTDVRFHDYGAMADYTELSTGYRKSIKAKYVMDCSGYGRVLPKLLDLDLPSDLPRRVALFTHIENDNRPSGSDEGYIWVISLAQGGWIWIIPFSDGVTSVGVVGKPGTFSFMEGSDDEILKTLLLQEDCLKERLGGMKFLMPAKKIEGYSVGIKGLFGDRYILVGNTTEFLDPVFSSGVTLALESSWKAQDLVGRFLDGDNVDFQKEYADYMMGGIDCFRNYVNSWYSGELQWLFFSHNKTAAVKNRVCSVLAGYVWDQNNQYVKRPKSALAAAVATLAPEEKFEVAG